MGLNRIYKVVWNKTKGCYVVVSELAKRVGRNKAKAIVISSAAMAMAVSPVVTSTVGAALNQAGTGSDNAVALGEAANANQARAVAIGKGATISSGQDTIAIGTDTKVEGHTSIVIGKNAKTTNNAEGTVVIGRDAFSEGSGKADRPNTVVGRGAYTAFGANGSYRMNASTALGFQAGSGIRVDSKANNKLVDNNTNADSNENVLVKAGYGLQDIKDAAQKVEMDKTKAFLQAGFAHNGLDKTGDSGKSTDIANGLSFYRKSDINEATAIGAEARAIGDQSIAIGGQVVAGDGVVALGGNDTDQLRNNKYQVVTDDAVNRTNVNTIDDYNLAYTESTTTVAGQFKKLVNRDMPTGYRSTYGQSGSVVIGMEAHSTTALGTAIGTNSVVRMGAFGATAIGAGSTVQANAEAAVAVGMGSVANGAYALAGGTASWAEYGDIALGYQAKASGKDGAIAMGRATNAQGDSSIMIGGANIASAAAQSTSFEKSNGAVTKKTVIEKINGKNVNREYTFAGTTSTNGTVAEAYKELTGLTMETAALDFAKNKNGHASTSLGVHALSKGDLSTAIGAGSRSEAIGSVALGVGAHATRQNAVAIGTGSTTDLVGTRQLSVSYDKDGNVVDDNSPNKAYTFNWAGGTNTAEGDVVSFGSSGSERQLKNVAAGRVAEDSTDAINGSQLNAISKKLATGWNIAGDPKTKVAGIGTDDQVNFVNGNGTTVTVTKQEEVKNGNTVTTPKGANVKFDIKAADGSITSNTSGISVNTDGDTIGKTADGKLKANTGTINTGNDGKAAPNTGDGNKLATVDTVVNAVNNAAWKATAGSVDSGTETGKSEEKIKAGDVVTFKAGNNLAIKQDGKNFIYSLKPELTGLTSSGFKNAAGDTTVIDGNGMTITPKDAPAKPVSLTKEGLDNGGKTIKNVTSGLTNYGPGTPKEGLVDLKTTAGTPAVPDTTAATVGDLRNMGWVVSSDKTTGELTKAYTDQVKNADEVKFVGEGGVTVSGKTENGIRTITVKAEAQEMPEQPVSYTTADGTKVYPKTVTKEDGTKEVKYYSEPNGKGNEIPKENVVASINGPEGTKAPTTLSNVAGNLDGAKKGTQVPTTEHAPVNTTNAAGPNYVNPNNAATVGDVLNAGWNLQNNGTAKDFVKPYDTVNFVNGANTTAVVTTSADGTTSNVTYNVTGLPVTYTDAEGNPVAKVGDKYYKVNNQGQPVDADGNPSTKVNDKGQPLDAQGNVIDPVDTTKPLKTALVNPTPEADKTSTTSPTSLNNVKNNIPTVNDADKKAYDVNGAPIDGKKNTAAPITAKEAADLLNPTKDGQPNPNFVGNNAATVSDVLNAGWNLQNNGEARDFVKPYDTVNFVNGANTTAVVTTAADGTTSDVTYNVTGLPVTFTDKDGKPVSKIGDKYYPVNEKGQPVTPDGKPAVKTNAEGKPVTEDGTVIEPIDTKANPLQSNLVNPNVENTKEKPNNQTTSPTQLGNVANGANTFAPVDGKKMANDGKWYPADQVEPNGQPKENVQPVAKPDNVGKAGLIDFSKSNPNNAATVGDLQNLGWIVSAEGNKYSDQVRNANEVKFVGEGTASVTGKTDENGVRTITVKVDDQVSTNNAQTPVVYTDKDGKKVYPIKGDDGTVTYHTTPDGKGDNDEVVPNNNVVTSINGPEGTTSPTELKNVKNNIPAVNDADKKVTNPDGTEKGTAGDVNNINKAPLTAAEAADLLNPTKDGKPNPNFVGNNAATVSDVLNAGWNLQNNGEARDFVKPFDTVNFVNGGNTTAVVTTAADGTTSDVTFNVTGLPITYTTADGKPVSKVGDKFYPVNEKGEPVSEAGNPVVGKNDAGDLVDKDGNVIKPIDTAANPLKSNLVNPNVANSEVAPNNQTTTPTTLNNVKSNLPTVNDADKKASDVDGNPIDGKNNTAAPITAADAADLLKPTKDGKPNPKFAGNNAATVSDVLNAGWNLQNNGTAKDFVKPYDTVNFVDGANTTAVVTTNEDGTTSNVTYNVTGLPVTFTDKDGKPVSKIGDKYYPVNEKGQPVTPDGKPAVKTNAEGKPVTEDGTVIEPIDTKANPLQSNLVNPNVENTKEKPNNQTTSPTQLGNVANGANTFAPVEDKKLGNDGKWYNAADVLPNGQPKENVQPVAKPENVGKAGLIDFSNSNPNNAATVGDLQNLGWIVSAEGNSYSDQVRNANEVKFVGKGTATVTGETDKNGVRTITVKVDDQVSTNNAVTPVVYTDKDGNKVYPIKGDDGTVTYHTTPDGKGDNDQVVPNNNVVTSINGPEGTTSPTELKNVKNNIPAVNDADKKVTNPDGTEKGTAGDVNNINKAPLTAAEAADLLNPTKDGKPNPNFVGNNAATVSDVLNAGWNLQNNGTAKDFVKPYDTVNFVDGANTTAVVTTNEDGTTSNVTYNVTGLPVTFTDKDGKPVSKIGDKYYPVNEKGQPVTPDGKPAVKTNAEGKPVTEDGTVIEPIDTAKDPLKSNMVNPNVANTADAPNNQTTTPTQLGNVKSNLPTVNDADKKASDVDGNPIDGKNNTAAPITAADAADLLKPTKDGKPNPKFAGNNAATVSDVLNAGWNLQNNGEARDFVKPYDTVNFVNGANTTAVVTTAADGTTSDVTYNVTGLPVTFTDKDGKPVSKIGDKYYPVNEKGQPVTPDGKPAVKTNAEGKPVTEDGTVIEPIDTKANPLQSNLVNPNVENTKEKPNNQTTSPTQLGNVANGANTFAPVDGKKMANDGKWYPADQVEPNGQPKTGAAPVEVPANVGKAGLIDFSKSNPNNAATVGDLQNLGWIVSAEGNKYSDQVRNANEVKFVGEGTASVTGKTDENGVRTITVKVDDQVSTNNAQTPVNYTNKDGKKVYPVKDENGNVTYHTTPDGKGKGDETVPAGDVITSLNGPEGTTAPTTLNNVKNNIPAVNDADKKVTNPDGTEKGTAGDVNNINKAPLTAAEAADLLKPTKDGKPNPNFAGNNAATVSDVLNAGWNLQNNGEARDFVKPFDTVNFVNGGNTTAVVTTAADGTTSDVTFNVTGLPITYTTADGKPVSKVGNKYYPVNEKGQPIGPDGKPAVKTAPNGDLLDKDGNVIKPIDTATNPLKSNMVNPNIANTADAPNNQTTTPTQLGNVANGAETFKPADDVKLANDGKWYPADQVEPNGKPKDGATPVASPLVAKNKAGDVLEKGNDGNWYKASDLEKGEPKPNAEEQFPEPKPNNADKAGLINFENSNPNNAATVGDLQNMGFVVSAKDNGYTEQMRNANKVEFKGDNGVQVTGKTLEDGTRQINVSLKEGRVTNNVIITGADGKEVKGVRGADGKIYKKDPKTGKAMKEELPIKPTDTVRNDGDGYVTGNSVATAIQKSGWNIGIGSTDKAFSEEAKTYERVNPKDNVKYVNGANTTVSMVVDEAADRDGATVTTTYVKVDVNRDLHIDSVTTGGPAKDKAGNPLKQVNGEYYPENALVNDGKVYPAGTVIIDGKAYPAGSAKDPKTKTVLKDGKPAPEAQPLTATPKDQLADGKDGAMTVKDAKGNDGVSATAKDGKGTLTLKDAGKDGKDASQVDISTAKAPADLENTPKDAVRANDGNWYAPADVTVEVKDGKTVVTPKAGKTPIPNAPTMDRIQYTGTDGKPRNVATMDDGLRFVGDDGETISKPLNSTMEFTGGNREDTGKPVAKAATTTGNIGVFNTDGKLSIQLAKDLDKLNSANFESKTDKAGNPLKVVDGKYYPEKAVVKEGKVYPEGTVIIDNKPYPAGTTKDAAGKVVNNGKPATEATPINPIDSKQVQDGPTSRLTGTGLTFNTPTPKDEKGNPLVLVDGKYYKADNLENGKPKADAKPEPVKPAQSTAFTPDGLVVTPETAKVRDANGNPVLDKDGREVVDPTKVVSFGSPTIVVDPKTGKPMVDPKTGDPVMKSGISAGGQVMANVAPGVLDTDAVNVSQLKGVANNINMRMNRMGAQAAAMGALRHLQYDPLEPTTIMAGVGTYKGEAALALGIAHYKNESTLFHAGASIGSRGDELMANAGVSWKFGSRADETAVKDTFRQGPISSSYTLQDKVSALEAQNQVQKDEINNLKAQLAEVLQYVKKG